MKKSVNLSEIKIDYQLLARFPPEFLIKNLFFPLEEKDGKKNRYQHVVKHYPNDYGPVMGLLNSNNDRSVREIIHRAVRPTGNRYEGIEVSQSLSRFLKVMDEV